MQFKRGADVFTADGRKVGSIDRVVIDPRTREVSHIVIRKGFLFAEDKVVPIDLIAKTTEDRIVLRSDVGDLDALPQFEETHYIPLYDSGTPSTADVPLYWYPPVGVLGYPGYVPPVPFYVEETERHIPENTVPLKEGSKVISSDGKHVGNVERIFADSQTGRVTHFVISQGLILKEKKLIPATWISSVLEDAVYLTVDTHQLDALPEYQSKPEQASTGV